ncbi:glycosyltransferase [Stakelama saccharophila]|uniref:Glycosyltransferase n=1 Tax=Stakelama saccharophila TaxID=3075605 RepID=A0ABZ0B8M8_9SPHN|nr:glycosyltransferase [Stakelama sp. W311]WNO53782.1 glycosyltransferase [Stakelama sp. W311]
MKRMRVVECIASLHERAAGTTVYFQRMMELLPGSDIEAIVLSTGAPAPDVPGQYFATDFSGCPWVAAMRPSRALREAMLMEARQADLIHSHGMWLLPNVYPGHAAVAANVPLVISPHGMLGREALRFSAFKKMAFWAVFQRRAAAAATCWHATSEKEAEELRAFGIDAPIAIMPIGVDFPALAGRSVRRQEVLFLGRLHPIKGIDALLRVWPGVAAQYPDWTLRIVGPRDDAAERYRARAEAALIPNLVFDDAVYGQEKWNCYRSAALFVLPTQNENFGVTISEALAAETPVICSDGAPWEGLRENRAGWWIPQTDDALRSALCAAIALPDSERRSMGRRGREWMLRDFSWEAVVAQTRDLYAWIGRGAPRPDFVYA